MPPRIPGSSCQPQLLLTCLEHAPARSLSSSGGVLVPLHRPSPSTSASSSPSASSPQPQGSSTRPFSTTPAPQETKLRREFKQWVAKYGDTLTKSKPGQTGYLSSVVKFIRGAETFPDMPFPLNPHFRSQRVLADSARERIWADVMVRGKPLKAVSAEYSVDMRRVAAVVRMKEIEKRWKMEGKRTAKAYARAIEDMLPTAKLDDNEPRNFEPINDIHVHSYTMQQLFVPTSESRQFTRADAAKAFGDKILPPDSRMRIPELVQLRKNIQDGMDRDEAYDAFVEAASQSERELATRQRARAQAAEERKVRVDAGRFEFRFEKINAEDVGPTGRARKAVGWRYGVPFMDRRRGEVKIPTSVE